jgi:aryl-alcohol dehydrogenase-like predicted oxidoreductase
VSAAAPRTEHAAFGEVARDRGVSAQQGLAWPGCWRLAPVRHPIPGASRPESITDSAAAAALVLTPEELARLDA